MLVLFTFTMCIMFIGRLVSVKQITAQDISPNGQTVILWSPYTDDRQIALEGIVEDFNATNEWGIRVEVVSFRNTGLLYDQMILQLIEINNSSGNRDHLPNMVIGFPHEIALYVLTEDTILDLTPYMNNPILGFSEADKADFVPSIMKIGYEPFSQQQLGLPTHLFAEVMVVNIDALDELGYERPPTTLAELVEMVCAFHEHGGWPDGKFGVAQGFQLPLEAEFLIGMNAANGGTILVENPAPTFTFNSSPLQEMLSTLRELHRRNCISIVQTSVDAIESFAAGQSLFYFGSTSTLPLLREKIALNYAIPFEWGVYGLPGANPNTMLTFGPIMSLINHSPESNLAAWLFLREFLDEDAQLEWIAAMGSLPIRLSTADALANAFADFLQWRQMQTLVSQSTLITLPALAGYDVIRLEIQFALQRIMASTSTLENELLALEILSNEILTEFAPSEMDD